MKSACNNCGQINELPDEELGSLVSCSKCEELFQAYPIIERHSNNRFDVITHHVDDSQRPEAEKIILRYYDKMPLEHWKAFYRKRKSIVTKDDFGIDDEKGLKVWEKEKLRYVNHYLAPQLTHEEIACCYEYLLERNSMLPFARESREKICCIFLALNIDRYLTANADELRDPISDKRPEDGIEYERFCAQKLEAAGWHTQVTKASSDQGCDVIVQKDGVRAVVQCKRYGKPVGNSAVQEIYGALNYYGASHAVVVTNSTYTPGAKSLAQSNGVILIHDSQIEALWSLVTA